MLDASNRIDGAGEVSTASFYWDLGGAYVEATDRMRFVLVDVSKARKRYNEAERIDLRDESDAWLYALARGYENREELASVMEEFPSLKEFAERYDRAVSDPEVIEAYEAQADWWRERESRECWLHDELKRVQEEGFAQGQERGLEQGRKQGRKQGRAKGVGDTVAFVVKRYMENFGCDKAEARRVLGVDELETEGADSPSLSEV